MDTSTPRDDDLRPDDGGAMTDRAGGPVRGFVTDLAAFEAFVATAPTPAKFRARYPDVVLVLPDQIATREYRNDNSRYFAKLGAQGRVVGGRFS